MSVSCEFTKYLTGCIQLIDKRLFWKSLMAKWLEQVSQWHVMYCHDLEVMSSNPSRVELWVLGPSVPIASRTWSINTISQCYYFLPQKCKQKSFEFRFEGFKFCRLFCFKGQSIPSLGSYANVYQRRRNAGTNK